MPLRCHRLRSFMNKSNQTMGKKTKPWLLLFTLRLVNGQLDRAVFIKLESAEAQRKYEMARGTRDREYLQPAFKVAHLAAGGRFINTLTCALTSTGPTAFRLLRQHLKCKQRLNLAKPKANVSGPEERGTESICNPLSRWHTLPPEAVLLTL